MKKYFSISLLCFSSLIIAQTSSTIKDSILSGGLYRSYTLYVPAIYNSAHSVPLLFNIHGYSGDGNQQMEFGDFRPIADTANFIIVHPTALGTTPSWNINSTVAASEADRTFLLNLLDTIKLQYTINASKLYSVGFSQGGLMSNCLACIENINFAAIASVGGGMSTDIYKACNPIRPVSVMEIHGTADALTGYDGTSSFNPSLPHNPPIDTVINYWVNRNHCNTIPTIANISDNNTSDNSTVQHSVYSGGYQGTSVELYKVISGGHSWPAETTTGGMTSPAAGNPMSIGNRNMDFNASKEIWRFFNQKSLATDVKEIEYLNDVHATIYPNPCKDSFTLFADNINRNEQPSIQIINLLGETIYQQAISQNNTQISTKDIKPGVYFYILQNKISTLKNGKIIIQ
jgi:polyhydroxybutyrate depolymerase